MNKGMSEEAVELTFIAALDNAEAIVDTSKIPEVQQWTGAVIGKFYGATAEGNYAHMEIPEIIAECAVKGTEGAWREFVNRTRARIRAVVIRRLERRVERLSQETVDDLTQDVYLRLYANKCRALRSAEALRENSLFRFLKVVASRVVEDHFRQLAFKREGSGPAIPFSSEAPLAGDQVSTDLLISKIEEVLKTLSQEAEFERDYRIFWLYYRQALTAREISSLPDIELTQKGVESVLMRQTRLIQAALGTIKGKSRGDRKA
jgi:DNA-directed RNA polymerase specialized sigma24 family protein